MRSQNRNAVTDIGGRYGAYSVGLVLICISIFLRGFQLGVRDFWFDESCTFYYLQNLFDWPEDSRLLEQSTNLPYYVLLRGWMAIFGDSESALRGMSVAASLLTIPFIGWAARRVGGREAWFAAVVLAAVHPLSVYYAREARAYALWVFMLAVMLWLLVEAVRSTRRSWWVAYGAALLFTLNLHYFTAFWAAASAAMAMLATDRRMALRRWSVTSVIALALFVPYFLLAVWPAARAGGSAWIADGDAGVAVVLRTLWAFLPMGNYPAHLRGLSMASGDTHSPWPVWVDHGAALVPLVLLAGAAWILMTRTRHEGGEVGDDRKALWALGRTVVIALLLPILYSILVRPIYLVGRYDLVAWPAFVVGMGCLMGAVWRRVGRGVAVGVILVAVCCSLVADARMLNPPLAASPNQQRAVWVAELTAAGDVVIALSYDRWALYYELHRAEFRGVVRSFPSWIDRQVGWVDTQDDLAALADGRVQVDARRLAEEMTEHSRAGAKVWLLADSLDVKNVGARAAIHAELIAAMGAAGLALEGADETFLIYRVVQRH